MKKGVLEEKLSLERTFMSSERTMLSQVRTGFASLLLGFALIKFFEDGATVFLGWIFNALGISVIIVAIILYPLRNKRIRRHYE